MSDIKFEVVKKIGMLSKSASGWEKQLNLVSWHDRGQKYDIREWGILHESLEAVICDTPRFHSLFTPAEIAEARHRLEELGYFKEGV